MREPPGGRGGGKGKGGKGDDVADGGRGGGRGGKGHGGRGGGKGKGGKGGRGHGGRGGGKGKGGKGGRGHAGRGGGGRGGGGRGECTTIEFHFTPRRLLWWHSELPAKCLNIEILVPILNQIGREFRRQVQRIPLKEQDPGRNRGEKIKEIFSGAGELPPWFNPDFPLSSNGEFLEINNDGNVKLLQEMVLPLLSNDGDKNYEKHYHFHPTSQGGLKNCVTLTIRFKVLPRVPVNRERW
jgi:hypothetical protein